MLYKLLQVFMSVINKIAIGTVQFGLDYGISNNTGRTSDIEIDQILKTASLYGIKYIDTASGYGNAEEVLGTKDLSDFKIISKFMPEENGKTLLNQFEVSKLKLKIKKLYGYLAHRPMDLLNNREQWQLLNNLKSSNLVQKIGFSLNKPEELLALLEENLIPDLIQVPYNFFDRRFERIMIQLKSTGCEIHTRSTFLQGLFFTDVNELPSFFDEVKPIIKDLQKKDFLPKLLLNFALNKEFIDNVVIGVENNTQLVENVESSSVSEELESFDKNLSEKILMPMYWPKK